MLDIACGAGEPALTVAEKVGPKGSVLATDFVEEMIGYARSKAQARSLSNVEFRCVDGEVINEMKDSFDAVTMRWGLMFMPDPVKCMHCANTALKPGGKAVISVWTEAANNPFVTVPLGVLKRHMDVPTPPPGAPGIFALANPDRLHSIFADAGFRDVAIEQVTIPMADFADRRRIRRLHPRTRGARGQPVRAVAGGDAGTRQERDRSGRREIQLKARARVSPGHYPRCRRHQVRNSDNRGLSPVLPSSMSAGFSGFVMLWVQLALPLHWPLLVAGAGTFVYRRKIKNRGKFFIMAWVLGYGIQGLIALPWSLIGLALSDLYRQFPILTVLNIYFLALTSLLLTVWAMHVIANRYWIRLFP